MPSREIVIDSHAHMFAPPNSHYEMHPDAHIRPEEDYSVATLKRAVEAAGVDRVLAISPWSYRWDNEYALDALEGNRRWLTIGVLVDPMNPEASQALERLVTLRGASGLRIQGAIHGLEPLDAREATPLWEMADSLGITVDVNATLDEYPQVERRLKQFPRIKVVLDHCGYVNKRHAPRNPNLAPVLRMASYPNAYVKLTFLPLASREAYPYSDVHWMAHELVEAFGPERCLFGSTFPIRPYGKDFTYEESVRLISKEAGFSDQQLTWIMGKTAMGLWQWSDGNE